MIYGIVNQVTQVPSVDHENLGDVEGLPWCIAIDNPSRNK